MAIERASEAILRASGAAERAKLGSRESIRGTWEPENTSHQSRTRPWRAELSRAEQSRAE